MTGYLALMVAYVLWAAARLYLIIPAIIAREAAIEEIMETVFHALIGAIYGGIAFLVHP